ncbi:hypothetical protein JW949_00175 [Candidatus Woesearchaeota archaeon]|nr:hypothetical protein [Candidatus Woesearchaeota archaeon]
MEINAKKRLLVVFILITLIMFSGYAYALQCYISNTKESPYYEVKSCGADCKRKDDEPTSRSECFSLISSDYESVRNEEDGLYTKYSEIGTRGEVTMWSNFLPGCTWPADRDVRCWQVFAKQPHLNRYVQFIEDEEHVKEEICSQGEESQGGGLWFDTKIKAGIGHRYYTYSCLHCEENWGNCDDNWDNGCEADLLTDSDHCGECGNACIGEQECNHGSCTETEESDVDEGCSDGIDNDEDGPVDMNDEDCQAACHDENKEEYEDYKEEAKTNPSAISGADGCCGDDGLDDKGYIDPSSIFLCDEDKDYDGGEIWMREWFPADGINNELKIHNIDLTDSNDDLISNAMNWFVCDATGDSPLGGIHVSNLQTFENACGPGERICAAPPGFEVDDSGDCESGKCCVKENNCYTIGYEPWEERSPNTCGECYVIVGNTKKDVDDPYKYESEPDEKTDTKEYKMKEDMNLSGSFIGNPNKECENQKGNFCPATSLCKGYWIHASDTDAENGCCYGYCIEEEVTELTCAERGGTIVPVSASDTDAVLKCFSEVSSIDTMDDPDHICCVDYRWNLEGPTVQGRNDSFVCYNRDDRNLWAECCYLGICDNINLVDDNNNFDNGNIFTTGSELYTIESFNKRIKGDTDYVTDWYESWTIEEDSSSVGAYMPGYQEVENQIAIKDYSDFSFIEFDIGFMDLMVDSVTFYLDDGSDTRKTYRLSDYTILPEITPNVFHHIMIPLDDINYPIKYYEFKYSFPVHGDATENSTIYLDDFVLRPKSGDTLYCSGPFRTWIDSLNPQTIDPDDFWSYGPQWYACNNKLSFGWTGTRCCGAESTLTEKEYYDDTNAGCWNSIYVKNDFTVTEALWGKNYGNRPSYEDNGIIFFDGAFYGCNLEKTIAAGDNLWNENVNVVRKDHYSVLGTHYCSPDGNIWKTLDQAPSMAILAARLYQLALNKTENDETISYTLHCANSSVINYDINAEAEISEYMINTQFKESLCVLKLVEGGEERIIMGAVVTNITGFMDEEIINYYPLKEEDTEPENICKGVYAQDSEFVNCMEYYNRNLGSGFYMYFNDKYRIAVFSQQEIAEFEEHNAIIRTWNRFLGFMRNLFGSEGEPVEDLPTIIQELYL